MVLASEIAAGAGGAEVGITVVHDRHARGVNELSPNVSTDLLCVVLVCTWTFGS